MYVYTAYVRIGPTPLMGILPLTSGASVGWWACCSVLPMSWMAVPLLTVVTYCTRVSCCVCAGQGATSEGWHSGPGQNRRGREDRLEGRWAFGTRYRYRVRVLSVRVGASLHVTCMYMIVCLCACLWICLHCWYWCRLHEVLTFSLCLGVVTAIESNGSKSRAVSVCVCLYTENVSYPCI